MDSIDELLKKVDYDDELNVFGNEAFDNYYYMKNEQKVLSDLLFNFDDTYNKYYYDLE